MYLNSRVERITIKANEILRQKKSDILVIIAPSDTEKGFFIDVCNNYKTGKEDTALRDRLEALDTLEEITESLDGYATNISNVRRSNEYK